MSRAPLSFRTFFASEAPCLNLPPCFRSRRPACKRSTNRIRRENVCLALFSPLCAPSVAVCIDFRRSRSLRSVAYTRSTNRQPRFRWGKCVRRALSFPLCVPGIVLYYTAVALHVTLPYFRSLRSVACKRNTNRKPRFRWEETGASHLLPPCMCPRGTTHCTYRHVVSKIFRL
jgi:hypothetical protein